MGKGRDTCGACDRARASVVPGAGSGTDEGSGPGSGGTRARARCGALLLLSSTSGLGVCGEEPDGLRSGAEENEGTMPCPGGDGAAGGAAGLADGRRPTEGLNFDPAFSVRNDIVQEEQAEREGWRG